MFSVLVPAKGGMLSSKLLKEMAGFDENCVQDCKLALYIFASEWVDSKLMLEVDI